MLDLARPDAAAPAPTTGADRPRRACRGRRPLALVGLVLVVLLGAGCIPATPQEQEIWVKTLEARRAAGIKADLLPHDDLTARAQWWAGTLAIRGTLAHSDLKTLPTKWTAAAENVGRGSSPKAVFDLLMGSAGHRANILDRRWTQMGVGVATAKNGSVFVVQVFQRG